MCLNRLGYIAWTCQPINVHNHVKLLSRLTYGTRKGKQLDSMLTSMKSMKFTKICTEEYFVDINKPRRKTFSGCRH